ncbi:hypothetical protein ACIBHX_32425 [Nonomuraea sp. NPDC050536]|uniref:hypothetical protein n=1 Tax=Nonomuraea sp. NPDC050536 TaxID=3364366 RepID=UPI0037C8DEF9
MFRHAASVAATCAVITGLVSGCDQAGCTPNPIVNAYQAYSPIVFAVLPEVIPKSIPGLAVSLGLFAADALAKYLIDHTVPQKKTWLLIEQTLHGQRKTSVFELNTDHELKVSVNSMQLKHVDLYIKEREIKVVIPPGTTANVAVTDAQGGDGVAVRGTVPGNLDGSQDLDTGRVFQDDQPGARTADIWIKTLGFDLGPKLINGATAAEFTGTGRPTLSACMSTPPTAWTDKLPFWAEDKDRSWCIKTNAGHYGLAVPKVADTFWIGPTEDVGAVSYLLWAQPGLAAAAATPVPEAENRGCR